MNVWFPQNEGNFLNGWKPVGFSRRTLLREVGIIKARSSYLVHQMRSEPAGQLNLIA